MTDFEPRRPLSVDLRGRVALITGAGGVIGGAIAARLADAGAALSLADLSAPASPRPSAEALLQACDVADPKQIEATVQATLERLGRLDILVTAAGVTSTGSFETVSVSEWDRVHACNLRGVFLCNQAVVAVMKRQRSGRILNIGSVLAKNGGNPRPWLHPEDQASAGNAAYGAAKAGVHALTLYLAKEMAAHGVTVNAIAPGPVASPMTTRLPERLIRQIPMGRLGGPDEVAALAAFLCSDEAGFITGEIIDVNGGLWVD